MAVHTRAAGTRYRIRRGDPGFLAEADVSTFLGVLKPILPIIVFVSEEGLCDVLVAVVSRKNRTNLASGFAKGGNLNPIGSAGEAAAVG